VVEKLIQYRARLDESDVVLTRLRRAVVLIAVFVIGSFSLVVGHARELYASGTMRYSVTASRMLHHS
jgi:hypothetical protein